MVGHTPFHDSELETIYQRILEYAAGGTLSFPWFFHSQAGDLIRQLLNVDAPSRIDSQVRPYSPNLSALIHQSLTKESHLLLVPSSAQ